MIGALNALIKDDPSACLVKSCEFIGNTYDSSKMLLFVIQAMYYIENIKNSVNDIYEKSETPLSAMIKSFPCSVICQFINQYNPTTSHLLKGKSYLEMYFLE